MIIRYPEKMINYICVFTIIFLMPFYLLQSRGLNPAQAGLILTIQPIIMAVVAPISGTLSDRIGVKWPFVTGMGVLAIGLFLLSRWGPDTPYYLVALALGVTGLGTSTFIYPNNSAIMGSASHNRRGIAAGVLATAGSVGMVLGVGLAGAIFTTILGQSGFKNGESALFYDPHQLFGCIRNCSPRCSYISDP